MLKARLALGMWSKTENASVNALPPAGFDKSKKGGNSSSGSTPKLPKAVLNPIERTVQLEDLIPTALAMAVTEKTVIKDFFGRVINDKKKDVAAGDKENGNLDGDAGPNTSAVSANKKTMAFKVPVVSFKFNEGYSNAVRKPLFLSDLL